MKDIRVQIKLKNNLILKRAEDLWGAITQGEIAKRLGVHASVLGNFLNFKENPLTKRKTAFEATGEEYWKEVVIKISKRLNSDPESIFPEHLREARNNAYSLEMEAAEILAICDGRRVQTPEDILITEEGEATILQCLDNLPFKEERIIRKRFGLGEVEKTLEEIAKEEGVSRERIRQIEIRALGKLRTGGYARKLRELRYS